MYEKNNPWVRIVCAAIRCSGITIVGARHFDKSMISQMTAMPDDIKWARGEQGFIDQFGNFYSREEAYEVISRNELQKIDIERNGSTTELFSEGLY